MDELSATNAMSKTNNPIFQRFIAWLSLLAFISTTVSAWGSLTHARERIALPQHGETGTNVIERHRKGDDCPAGLTFATGTSQITGGPPGAFDRTTQQS